MLSSPNPFPDLSGFPINPLTEVSTSEYALPSCSGQNHCRLSFTPWIQLRGKACGLYLETMSFRIHPLPPP